MDKIHEYLTAVEEYLRTILANEELSTTAQIKRRHLLDKFYALELPPNVVRKSNGDLAGVGTAGAITENKVVKLSSNSGSISTSRSTQQNGHIARASNVIEDVSVRTDSSDGFYEDPDLIDGRCTATSDAGSDTEYESYTEAEEHMYINNGISSQVSDNSEEIQLPRLRAKKKKKKDSSAATCLTQVIYSGYLYQKGMLTWTQRWCAISDQQLLCYRSDRDSKPLLCLPLSGRDIVYTLKPDCRFNHALRISRPGSETHWFYTDGKDLADNWLLQLCSASVAVWPKKIDTISCESDDLSTTLKTDESSVGDNQSSHTNLSGGSSEGGSGDGVVQSAGENNTATLRRQNNADPRKKSKIGEIGDSLQTLIGTLSKKKGDKIKRALTDVSNADSENTVLAGYVNVNCESSGSKWVKRFCVVKRHRFDCYKDPLDETIEFSVPLYDAKVDLAHKRLKRELALRLVNDGKDTLIEAFNETDYARWLNMLVRETSSSGGDKECADGIYDEVYNWAVYQSGEQVAASAPAPPPPPPPRQPPPKVPLHTGPQAAAVVQARDENDYIEPQMVFDNMFDDDGPIVSKDDGLGLEEVVNSAFKHLREGSNMRAPSPVRKAELKTHVRSSSSSPASSKRVVAERSNLPSKLVSSGSKDTENNSSTISPSKDPAIVKAHCGPTIDEDKELLEATQNPILIELRREKVKKSDTQDKAQFEGKLGELRQLYDDMKKRRLTLRGSLQMATSSRKTSLEEELQKLDREIETTEREMTKLSFLAPQSTASDRFRRTDEFRRSISTPRATAAAVDGAQRVPSFVGVTRNASLRETNSRLASEGVLNHSSSSATSSPTAIRRRYMEATSTEKRSSFSGISSSTSARDCRNNVTARTSLSGLSKTSSLSGNSLSSTSVKTRVSSTLPAGLSASSCLERCNADQLDAAESSARKVVQERLKLWESLSDNKPGSS